MLCCVGLFGGLYVGQSLGGHWTITAPAIGFGLGLFGDTKLMRGMHGHNTSNGDHNTKMSSYDSSPKAEQTEIPLLQSGDINTREVRRDSG
jgi:hypothetical protein